MAGVCICSCFRHQEFCLKLVMEKYLGVFLREKVTKFNLVTITVISGVLPGFRKKFKSPKPSGKKLLGPAQPAILRKE